jgi:hypothetical protein
MSKLLFPRLKTGIYFVVLQTIDQLVQERAVRKSDPAQFSENVGPGVEAGIAEQPSSMVGFSLNLTSRLPVVTDLLDRQAKVQP